MVKKIYFICIILVIFAIYFVSAANVLDELHLNIQTTDPNTGEVLPGTFAFVFNITANSDCSGVVYSNSTTLTTDSRGIVSYYLQNINLNFTQQYYLCYYRDGVLINSSKISRSPYSFTAKNTTLSGLMIDQNLNMGSYNITAAYFIGDGSQLTNLNVSAINYWLKNASALYYNSGNVGIGTSNPGVKLDVVGSIGVSSDILASGSVQATNYMRTPTFTPYTSGGNINFTNYARDSAVMTINSTSGNVGIGTTNPRYPLDVNGYVNTPIDTGGYAVNTNPALVQRNNLGGIAVGFVNYYSRIVFDNTNSGIIHLQAGDSIAERMTIRGDSGNVGIGTTNPSQMLHLVGGSIKIDNGQKLYMGDSTNYITLNAWTTSSANGITLQTTDGAYPIIFKTNSSEAMRIVSSGNVGIGTTSPNNFKLQSAGSIGPNADNTYNLGSGSYRFANIYGTNIYGSLYTSQTPGSVLFAGASGEVAAHNDAFFWDNTNERLGIGTTTPYWNVDIAGNLRIQGNNVIRFGGTGSSDTEWYIQNDASNNLNFAESGVADNRLYLKSGGNVGIGTTAPGAKLDINGKIRIDGFTDAAATGITPEIVAKTTAGNIGLIFTDDAATNPKQIKLTPDANYNLQIQAQQVGVGTLNLLLNPSGGNIGIGTTAPVKALDVVGSINATSYVNASTDVCIQGTTKCLSSAASSAANAVSGSGTATYIPLWNGTTSLNNSVIYQSGGNVGVGTISPNANLEIKGSSGLLVNGSTNLGRITITGVGDGYTQGDILLKTSLGSTPASRGLGIYTFNQGNDATWYFGNSYSQAYSDGFAINRKAGASFDVSTAAVGESSNFFFINNAGGVGIGTTAPVKKLDVVGDINATGNLYANNIYANNTYSYYNITNLPVSGSGNVNGSGSVGYIPYWNGTTSINNSNIYQLGGNIGINTSSPGKILELKGDTSGPMIRYNRAGAYTWDVGLDGTSNFVFNSQTGGTVMDIGYLGNVGIGTTSPQAHWKLDVRNADPRYGILNGDGTDFLGFIGSGDSGNSLIAWGDNGSNRALEFGTYSSMSQGGWSEKMRITGAGNVGIGTTNPYQKLNVAGGVLINGGTSDTVLTGSQTQSGMLIIGNAAYWGIRQATNNSFNLDVYNSGTPLTALSVLQNGNVGIGTTAPKNTLNVVGTLNVTNATGQIGLYQDANANIGIGTPSPGYNLVVNNSGTVTSDVRTSSATGAARIFTHNDAGSAFGMIKYGSSAAGNNDFGQTAAGSAQFYNDAGSMIIGNTANANLYFGTNALPRMTIDYNGNVGIGTSSPSGVLDINTSGGADAIKFQQPGSTEGGITFYDATNRVDISRVGNTLNFVSSAGYPSGSTMTVDVANGKVGIGTTSPGAKLEIAGTPGSVAGSGILFSGNTAIWQGASSDLRIRPAGTDIATFTSSGVGINTTTPQNTLNIVGTLNVTNATGQIGLYQDANANIGIGTPSPGYKLEVSGSSYFGGGTTYLYSTSNYLGSSAGSSTFNLRNNTLSWSNGIINSNGSVGIGTASPATTLHVNGSAIINGTLNMDSNKIINLANGSSATDAATYGQLQSINTTLNNVNGSLSNYIPYVNSNQNVSLGDYNFSVGNSDFFVNANTGRVGIGTTSPTSQLTINGTSPSIGSFEILNSAGSSKFFVNATSGNVGVNYSNPSHRIEIGTDGSYSASQGLFFDSATGIYRIANTQLGIGGGSNDVIIENGGIVRTASYFRLASSNTAANPMYTFNSDANTGMFNPSADAIAWATGGSERFRVDSSGNVGIGTTTPTSMLHVAGNMSTFGNTSLGSGALFVNNNTGYVGIGTTSPQNILHVKGASTASILFEAPSSYAEFALKSGVSGGTTWYQGTGWANAGVGNFYIQKTGLSYPYMIVNGSGLIGINTTTPQNTLNVVGDANVTDNFTVDGGTLFANAVLNRVGIGTFTPQNTLNVVGDINATGNIYANNTYAYYNSTSLNSLTDLSISNNLTIGRNLSVSGNAFFVNNNTGYVGIGKTNPIYPLDVVGSAEISNTLYLNTWSSYTGGASYSQISHSNKMILFSANNSERMRISDFGLIGINTTSPVNTLNVVGDANVTGNFYAGNVYANNTYAYYNITSWNNPYSYLNSSGGGVNGSGTTNYIAKWNSSGSLTNSVIYDNGTFVGIGTASPSSLLEVSQSNAGNIGGQVMITNSANSASDAESLVFRSGTNNRAEIRSVVGVNPYYGSLQFFTGLGATMNERMRIDGNSGNIGINTTTPQNTLNIVGTVNVTNSQIKTYMQGGAFVIEG